MPFSFIAPIVGGIGSALIGSNAAENAAGIQAQAETAALAQQQSMFNTLNQQQQPYLQTGYSALNNLSGAVGTQAPGSLTNTPATYNPIQTQQFSTLTPFTAQDLNSYLAPNYQWMLNQGKQAATQATNVGGGGSNLGLAAADFAENYAGNAYQNAVNNYITQQQQGFNEQQTQQQNTVQNALAQQGLTFNELQSNQTNIFNRLASLANLGQTSLGQITPATTSAMNTIGGTIGNIGTAQAAGIIGQANALSGGLTNLGNYGLLSGLINPSSTSSGSSGGGYFGGIGSSGTTDNSIYSLLGTY